MNLHEQLATHLDRQPFIDPSAFIAPNATLLGNVHVEAEASIWHHCVLRADLNRIHVGPRSNIQDGCVVHLSDSLPTVLGELVTVGHKAVLHACSIQSEVLVGMNAVVLDGAEIGARSIIGAGALVTGGKKFPPGSLILGSPARVVRTLPLDEQQDIRTWALKYVALSRAYLARGLQAGGSNQSSTPQP